MSRITLIDPADATGMVPNVPMNAFHVRMRHGA